MNKFLTKIAKKYSESDDEYKDYGRAFGKGLGYGVASHFAAGKLGFGPRSRYMISGPMALVGIGSSLTNQRREHQLHSIKLDGANQRAALVNARLNKSASEDPNQLKKDLINTGTIATMGGLGNVVADKMVHGSKGGGMKSFLVGTGVGLGADFIGVKINNAVNKHIDKRAKK